MKQPSDLPPEKTTSNSQDSTGELSMEEILASIRRIVTEDTPEESINQPEAQRAKASEEGVIELTQMLQDDGGVVDLRHPAPQAPSSHLSSVPSNTQATAQRAEVRPAPTYAPAYQQAPSQQVAAAPVSPPPAPEMPSLEAIERDAMISNQIADTVAKKLARLAEANAQAQQSSAFSNVTLEALTRDIIRPFLYEWLEKNFEPLLTKLMKNWLESNLPDMVERVVDEEIRKITTTPDEL